MGYPNGLYIDATKGVPTDNNIPGGLFVQNTIIAGCTTPVLYSLGTNANIPTTPNTTATISAWFNTATYGNSTLTNNTEVGLTDAFNYSNPDFNPSASSVTVSGASFSHPKLATGFSAVVYKGACAPGDTWWKTWTRF